MVRPGRPKMSPTKSIRNEPNPLVVNKIDGTTRQRDRRTVRPALLRAKKKAAGISRLRFSVSALFVSAAARGSSRAMNGARTGSATHSAGRHSSCPASPKTSRASHPFARENTGSRLRKNMPVRGLMRCRYSGMRGCKDPVICGSRVGRGMGEPTRVGWSNRTSRHQPAEVRRDASARNRQRSGAGFSNDDGRRRRCGCCRRWRRGRRPTGGSFRHARNNRVIIGVPLAVVAAGHPCPSGTVDEGP